MQWLGRMARFNLAQVRRAMKRNGQSRMRRLNGNSTSQGAIAGASRRRAPQKPPVGKTGALPTGIVTGGLRIP